MTQTSKSPLFTIEQIELIRRLRNSGVTKEQVIQAFEELERMDVELGRTFNVPIMGNGSNSSSNSSTPVTTTTTSSNTVSSGHNATAAASLINPFTYLQLQQHLLRQLTVAAHMNNTGNHGDTSVDYSIARYGPSLRISSPNCSLPEC